MKSKISRIPKPFDRSEIERQEFAEAILRELPRDGSVEVKPGLTLFREVLEKISCRAIVG
jgi:hypothetical protein